MRFLWDCAIIFTFSCLTTPPLDSASSSIFAGPSAASFAACEAWIQAIGVRFSCVLLVRFCCAPVHRRMLGHPQQPRLLVN